MRLVRVSTNTDWKGRPDQRIEILADSDDRTHLVGVADADIRQWQDADLVQDAEEGFDVVQGEWEQENERWEMDGRDALARQFVYKFDDGGTCSICYHTIE